MMSQQVLVTFATKHGATAEIAEKIGEVIEGAGLPTDVKPVQDVKDLTPYSAVILGSAVYMGRWRKEAAKFLEKHEGALAERDVWLFSSGPTDEGDVEELMDGWTFPEGQKPIAERIKPHEIVVFHGELELDKLAFWEKMIIKNIKVPTGDFRDWGMITDWARGVADTLKETAV
jgi:menaquinone-dependent protoporphyrinogen oxidase